MIALLLAVSISQIDAGPRPESIVHLLRMNAIDSPRRMIISTRGIFPISRYLTLASRLQTMRESERIAWLRMFARSGELDEPAILLARMLITSRQGQPLRVIRAYIGPHRASNDNSFADSPLELFDGAPFYVASEASGEGIPEDATEYVEYLLENGTWRETRFKTQSNAEILRIAERYLASLEAKGFQVTEEFRKDVVLQASVPVRPSASTSTTSYRFSHQGRTRIHSLARRVGIAAS